MILSNSLPFIKAYVESINAAIKEQNPAHALSRIQCCWLGFLILGLLVTNSFCFSRFERYGLGKFKTKQMSWMFRRTKIMWEQLLFASIAHIISSYRIRYGVLVVDDTDIQRSKNAKELGALHKIKDKVTGGYINGQNIVFLLLVCEKVTIPVGFSFHQPDPKKTAWIKEEERLRKKGVQKKNRPKKPEHDPAYPTKKELALELIANFTKSFGDVKIKAVLADAAYGSVDFMDKAAEYTNQNQVISQIKKTQHILVNNRWISAEEFFKNYGGKKEKIKLRGKEKEVTYRSGVFKVKSHNKKCYVIALKYEGEEEYRYLIARDATWNDIDIIKAYAFRWIVEVFIQDWKQYEGWNQLAKQPGIEGSNRGVILSLLCDHALLLHDDQKVLIEAKKPVATVGSLREQVMMESLKCFIEEIISSEDPKALYDKYCEKISEAFGLSSSIKHMQNNELAFLCENP